MLPYHVQTKYILVLYILLPTYVISTTTKTQPIQGNFTSLKNNNYTLQDVTIGGEREKITVYKAPEQKDVIIPELHFDPKQYPLCIDLSDIARITVPYPYATWFYKPNPTRRKKDKYLMLTIAWHDTNRPDTHVLINPKIRFAGTLIKKENRSHKSLYFSSIKELTLIIAPE